MTQRVPRRLMDRHLQLPVDPLVESSPEPGFLERYPDQAAHIAYIIAEWSALENKLITLASLSMMRDAHVISPMVYAIESSGGRLEALRAAFKLIWRDDRANLDTIEGIMDEAKKRLTVRNNYAHALYGQSENGQLARIQVRTLGIAVPPEDPDPSILVPLHEVKEELKRMKDLSHRVGRLLMTTIQARGLWRPPPPEPPASPVPPQNQTGTDDARTSP